MKTRRLPLIIGLVLALGTGVLLLGYLTSLRPSGTAAQTRPVLVATHDIAAGAAITSDLFTVQPRIATQVDPDAISDPKAVVGDLSLVAIPAGSVVTQSKVGLASAATLPARLPIGMRAASISIDNVKGVAGLVAPGDRVDVIAIPPRSGDETPRGVAILRDVLVLAMGLDLQAAPISAPLALGSPAPALSTVTLALTPNQVDLIAGADLNTSLRLALRNPKEASGTFPTEVLRLAPGGSGATSVAAAAPAPDVLAPAEPAPAATDGTSGVIMIDGDRVGSGATATH